VGKGAIGVAKTSKNIVGEIAESVGKSMDKPTARTVLRDATVDLTELAGKLAVKRPLLKAWFDLDMPSWFKIELDKFSKRPALEGYLDELEKDFRDTPGIKKWLHKMEKTVWMPGDIWKKLSLTVSGAFHYIKSLSYE
jgi:hypothetical protein